VESGAIPMQVVSCGGYIYLAPYLTDFKVPRHAVD
jgi:hypothetical protein